MLGSQSGFRLFFDFFRNPFSPGRGAPLFPAFSQLENHLGSSRSGNFFRISRNIHTEGNDRLVEASPLQGGRTWPASTKLAYDFKNLFPPSEFLTNPCSPLFIKATNHLCGQGAHLTTTVSCPLLQFRDRFRPAPQPASALDIGHTGGNISISWYRF